MTGEASVTMNETRTGSPTAFPMWGLVLSAIRLAANLMLFASDQVVARALQTII